MTKGWPKGVPRKPKVNDGAVVSEKNLEEVLQSVSIAPRRKINLTNPKFDPFTPYKKDEKHYHYRALNTKPENISVRQAEGYTLIPEARFGDLVLGKIPRDMHEEMVDTTQERTSNQTTAAVEQFKEEASRSGVESFEEKD